MSAMEDTPPGQYGHKKKPEYVERLNLRSW